ncbi:hypothetical protein C8Q74DRAFT_1365064 [Fomes fomentarius]|nr:hypothetical protein C8Q74DRAFT_1365064 [Fomes fomentarius]
MSSSARRARLTQEWTQCDSTEWKDFYQQWWGRDFDVNADVLNVASSTIWISLCLLELTGGLLLVRKEYAVMYTRLLNAGRQSLLPSGVVVSGQPGIGKSYFAVYVLLRRLADRQPTLFSASNETTFLFDESGVRETPSPTVRAHHVFELLGKAEPRLWSLIDPGPKVEPISPCITQAFFYVVFASPNGKRYKHLTARGATLWIMSSWELSDLLRLIKFGGIPGADPSEYEDEHAVQQLCSLCGPCPRDIYMFLADPYAYGEGVHEQIWDLEQAAQISKLFNDPAAIDKFSHRLVMVTRVGELREDSLLTDGYIVHAKTRLIYQLLVDRIVMLSFKEAKALFSLCKLKGPAAAYFAGMVFEAIATLCMCGAAPATDDIFRGFVPMTAVPGPEKYPHGFSYKPEKATATLTVNNRALTLSQSQEVDSLPPNPTATCSALCPTKSLAQFRYGKVADIANIMEGMYVPEASNNALFDAFYVDEKDDCSSGFATVEEIRAKVETARPGKRVEVKYVLVVPYQDKWALRWNMANGFSKVPGEVYVQFLRVQGSVPHVKFDLDLIVQ